jgi:hypothetical protein
MGCDREASRKAQGDFDARRGGADAGTAFVFVTPRRWRGKEKWARARRAELIWRDVQVLDADDLELWLEKAPAVALWLGEQLGMAVAGLHSVEAWWERWSAQTRHAITTEAVLAGREEAAADFDEALRDGGAFVGVRADSGEEAAAFACAALIASGQAQRSAVVSEVSAYRLIEANPGVRVVVAATSELGGGWHPRGDTVLVVPTNPSRAGRGPDRAGTEIMLPRILRHDFERVLVDLGHDPADAARLARNTGRSWSIYRRVESRNPAMAHPGWLERSAARCLTTLCLVGSWNAGHPGDMKVVERIAGRPRADLERELRELAGVDDPPVIRIGEVWKAVSPVELLHLMGPRIGSDELDRFYETLEDVLSERDPLLHLSAAERWAAAREGRERSASGLLIDGMADSLVKLSVAGDLVEAIAPARPATRAALLVRRLLSGADRDRWLSLAHVLREFAEAAPEEYLLQIEAGLRRSDGGPLALIRETGGDGPVGGSCWHADLLWSLELLAWSPRRLTKVATLLASMSAEPIAGNWANTPMAALVSLFRPWWPQTATDEPGRIAAIDRVIERNPDAGWALLNELGTGGGSTATPNAQPQWRVDDLGHTRPPGWRSATYERAIRDRLVASAAGRADRVAALLGELRAFGAGGQAAVLQEAAAFVGGEDADRELLRAALRKYLWWESSFNAEGDRGVQPHLERAQRLYRSLEPQDLSIRHGWLFAANWIEVPDGPALDDGVEKRVEELRREALREILDVRGWSGVLELARSVVEPGLVGFALGRMEGIELDPGTLIPLIRERDDAAAEARLLRGYLIGLAPDAVEALLLELEARTEVAGDPRTWVELLLLLPAGPLAWTRADSGPDEVRAEYWRRMSPPLHMREHVDLVLERLMEFERPRTALALAQFRPAEIAPGRLLDMLAAFAQGQEPEGPLLEHWRLQRVVAALDGAEGVDALRLAQLEWALYPILKHGRVGPRTLFQQVVGNPDFFAQLIETAYPRRSDGEAGNGPAETIDESAHDRVGDAHWLLHDLNLLPGSDRNGRVDPQRFRDWISLVRRRFAGTDLEDLVEDRIGALLACSPDGDDGHWPHELVREVLEGEGAKILHDAFVVGVRNRRGATSRAYNEGGDQERRLASAYEAKAEAVCHRWPETGEVLRRLAAAYVREAEREDEDARLRIER